MTKQRTLNDTARWYDAGMRLHWGGEYPAFRDSLIRQFGEFRDKTILDYGCGTCLLLQHIKTHYDYDGLYIACDTGTKMLEAARVKNIPHHRLVLKQIPENPSLDLGPAEVDIAVSSLITHQLSPERKRAMFGEIFRVLRTGGVLALAEFGRAEGMRGRLGEFYIRHVWGRVVPAAGRNCAENFAGAVPGLLKETGFHSVAVTARWKGMIDIIRAVKPVGRV